MSVLNELEQFLFGGKRPLKIRGSLVLENDTVAKLTEAGYKYNQMTDVYTLDEVEADNTGLKYDEDKLRWDLLPLDAVEEAVRIMTFGAKKYGDNNWQDVENAKNRYFAALMRHLVAWRNGEQNDPESGMLHLSHALCNVIFLTWLEKR